MTGHIAIVILYPWRWLSIAVPALLLLHSLFSLWRNTARALLLADADEQMANLCDRANLPDQAAEYRRRAKQWRRLAWPRHPRKEKTA